VSATCRSCGAAIIWAKHETTGKLSCYDEEPTLRGTWGLVRRGNETVARKLTPELAADPRMKRRTSHFATCPNAASHRRTPDTGGETP
jgi:hypothetical protein